MAGEGEIQFAEPIIHRLQSFLTGKEAAQTTIVSKSWHSAWLTRTNLDLDDTHFRPRGSQCSNDYSCFLKFKKYAKNTIKRYEQSNLKIECFKLCMETDNYGRTELAHKLIVKALRIGATRLCLQINRSAFVLPNEVFGADNLVELSVSGCTIELDDGVVIKCRGLESLNLYDNVYGITIDTVSKIVSSCPFIETLSLLSNVYHEYEQLNKNVGVEERARRDAAWQAAADAMVVGVVDNLSRLRCLVLGYESFQTLCLDDLLSRFSYLKDFTLYMTVRYDEGPNPRVKFDVPSVRKFTYEGAVIPSLSFMSTPPSREWESNVSIRCNTKNGLSASWFNELSALLTGMSQSKTHLSLHIDNNAVRYDYNVGDKIIQGLCQHELENLTIDMKDLPTLICYAFFDGLFRVCRPKLITQYYEEDPNKRRYNGRSRTNIDFLCQTLEQGINLKVSGPTQFMYGLNDLEEVNAQTLDMENVPAAEWRPIPFDEHVQEHERVRLLLKWKPS